MMMTQTQEHNVPALRFPEFNGAWKEERIGDVFEINAGGDVDKGTFSKAKTEKYMYPIYANSEKNKGLYGFSSSYREVGGCITVSGRGSLGTPTARDHKFTPIVRLLVLRPKVKQDIFFFEYRISRTQFFVESTGVPQLTGPQISGYKIQYPTLPEQQKIASFLSSVDGKIEQLGKKKALLEQYKKGIMQKLFSQELRFKDAQGNDFPDWEEKRLGDVVKIFDGTHQTPKYVKSGVPFYSVEHVTANQFKTTKFISEEVFEKENKRVSIEKGDILMTRIGSIGVAKYVDWDVRASFYVSLALIKPTTGVIGGYLAQCIVDEGFQRELWKRTIHVAFPKKINLGEIGNCHFCLPHKLEQQKIAGFLSSIDRKIELVTSELNHAKTFKKGLLQQMFI